MRPDKERFADDNAKQARFTRLRQNIRQAAERRRQLPSGATERDLGILELGKQAETSQEHVIPPVAGRPCKPHLSTRILESIPYEKEAALCGFLRKAIVQS